MARKARTILATLALALVPQLAQAQSKSANVGIDVEIPPYAAGLAATAEGAVGMDTFDTGGGLLVKGLDTLAPSAQGGVSVFSPAGTHVSARVVTAAPGAAPTAMATLLQKSDTDFKGMNRADFTVVPTPLCGQVTGRSVVSVLIAAL